MASSTRTLDRTAGFAQVVRQMRQIRADLEASRLRDCEACLTPQVATRYETEVGGYVCADGCPG